MATEAEYDAILAENPVERPVEKPSKPLRKPRLTPNGQPVRVFKLVFNDRCLAYLDAQHAKNGLAIVDIVRQIVGDRVDEIERASQPRPTRSKSTKPDIGPTTVVADTLSVDDVDEAFCEHGHKLTYDPENSCPQCIEEFLRS